MYSVLVLSTLCFPTYPSTSTGCSGHIPQQTDLGRTHTRTKFNRNHSRVQVFSVPVYNVLQYSSTSQYLVVKYWSAVCHIRKSSNVQFCTGVLYCTTNAYDLHYSTGLQYCTTDAPVLLLCSQTNSVQLFCSTVYSTPEWSYSVTHTQSNFKRLQDKQDLPYSIYNSTTILCDIVQLYRSPSSIYSMTAIVSPPSEHN